MADLKRALAFAMSVLLILGVAQISLAQEKAAPKVKHHAGTVKSVDAAAGTIFTLFNPAPVPAKGHYFNAMRIERPTGNLFSPDFSLPDLDRRMVRLRDFQGKIVFLNFWATWCPPCRQEMPSMERLYQDFKDKGLVMLAVNIRESPEKVRSFMQDFRLSFTALLDSKGKVSELYGVFAIPTTYIIGGRGEVIGRAIGMRNWASEEAKSQFRDVIENSDIVKSGRRVR